MKLDEYGEDAAAHDRGALEGGGGAEHEGDKNTLHCCVGSKRILASDGLSVKLVEGDVRASVENLP